MPCENSSQSRATISSTISGKWSHIATFSDTLARTPSSSKRASIRQKPARLP